MLPIAQYLLSHSGLRHGLSRRDCRGAVRTRVQGIVSSDPRFPAVIGSRTFQHSVLCHSSSWSRMSGSPILAPLPTLTESRMVGVNAGHVNLQGIGGGVLSHFVCSDYVLELLASHGDEQAAERLGT